MSLADVMFTRERIAAARTRILEKTEEVRVARQHQREMDAAMREAQFQIEDAKTETARLEAQLSALEAEAQKYGLPESQTWTDLIRVEVEAKARELEAKASGET